MNFQPYAPRPLSFLGVDAAAGYQLKAYSILYGEEPFNRERFDGGWKLAVAALPQPAVTPHRPGVGFIILHQGRTADYLILAWWDQENELPLRVFVRDEFGWRAAQGGESVCVWDLKVIGWERDAYVATVLAGRPMEDYLAMTWEGYA